MHTRGPGSDAHGAYARSGREHRRRRWPRDARGGRDPVFHRTVAGGRRWRDADAGRRGCDGGRSLVRRAWFLVLLGGCQYVIGIEPTKLQPDAPPLAIDAAPDAPPPPPVDVGDGHDGPLTV